MHVRVALDGDGPIAVKTATSEDAARLRLEAERLERASHPGLVSVVEPVDKGNPELRTRFAGDPVSHWTGSVACIAGLGAAVASTLADLHNTGVVHGRLDSTHILVGEDGRPRLCGLSHPGGAAPEDDVAALGRVLAGLLERRPAERRRPLRWPRAVGADRRALEQVIAQAVDPVPSRRPSARLLSASILRAVDGAELPAGGRPPMATAPAYVPPDEELLDLVFTHEMSDDERWAQAFGDEPPTLDKDIEPPGPAAPEPGRDRHGSRARVAAGSGLAVAAVAAGVVVVGGWGSSSGSAPRQDSALAPVPVAAGCPAASAPAADVDGDGCAESLAIEGGNISAGSSRWALGERGDVAAVGDWDCDGLAAPALLRPATGDVFVFPGWAAESAPVTVEARDRLPGAVAIRAERGDDGCDDLVVELQSGAATTVEVAR